MTRDRRRHARYQPSDGPATPPGAICGARHSTTTDEPRRINCKRCLAYLKAHYPERYNAATKDKE